MHVEVDWAGLERRRRRLPRSAFGSDVMDLVIQGEVDRTPSPALADRVREAIRAAGLIGGPTQKDKTVPIPYRAAMPVTDEGLAVWVNGPWRPNVERIVEALETSPQLADVSDLTGPVGGTVRLTVSPQAASWNTDGFWRLGTFPTLCLILPIEPSLADGPHNDRGVPLFRWGVPHELTEQVVTTATRFVFDPDWGAPTPQLIRLTGHGAVLGRGLQSVRVGPADAATALRETLPRVDSGHVVQLWSSTHAPRTIGEAPDGHINAVGFKMGGLSSWVHYGPAPAQAKIDRLIALARHFGDHLQAGAIGPSMVAESGSEGLSGWDRWFHRDRWRSQVPNVSPYLIVTQHHLDRAGTLDGWTFTPLTPDRWLLTLDVDPDQLLRLTSDFGALVDWRGDASGSSPEHARARDGLGDMLYRGNNMYDPL